MKKIEALAKLYVALHVDENQTINEIVNSLNNDANNDYLSENKARNGRTVLWYADESKELAIYVDTLEFLGEDEIEKELH